MAPVTLARLLRFAVLVSLLVSLCAVSLAAANHIPGQPCNNCASHAHWPTITGAVKKAKASSRSFKGTSRPDELLGHHGSDVLSGRDSSDILWGDWDGVGQPSGQHDVIYGGAGNDFIYASHGRNTIYGGPGNDAISAHYGHGLVDCGPGRDVYHVPRSRRHSYRVRNCEKVDYRSERKRGSGLVPLR